MKLKRPDIGTKWVPVGDHMCNYKVITPPGAVVARIPEGHGRNTRATTKAMAALPEVMDELERIHFATGHWDDTDLRPEGTKMVHEWATKAMLKMGYTEEKEGDE